MATINTINSVQDQETGDWLPKSDATNPDGRKPDESNKRDRRVKSSDYTEEVLAQEFESLWVGNLLYDHDCGEWFYWNEEQGRWRKVETKLVLHFIREICQALGLEHDRALACASTYKGVERICQVSPLFATTSKVWDTDDFLLGVPGGTVELRTGELREANKEDRITKQTPIAPDHELPHPVFEKFLNEITLNNEELRRYLQRVAGYCATGSVREHKLFFIYGVGQNGKSVYVNVLSQALGDYVVDAPMDAFVRKQGERHPTAIAGLQGARLVTATETDEGRYWDEAGLKKLTGGDPVTARFMRKDFFTYVPKFKPIIVGNHAPLLINPGEAMRRRLQLIPFEFKADPPDKELMDKLRPEMPAILAWIIDGARDWYENGLSLPAVVAAETTEYFSAQDLLIEWIDQCCEAGENFFCLSSVLYTSWKVWATERGALEEISSNKRLNRVLRDRRLVKARRERSGTMMYGLTLRVESKPDARTGEREDPQ